MIIRDAKGITAVVHLYDNNTGIDFVEEYLNAGSLARDAYGVYMVDDVYYIDDYVTDACNGCNPDFEGKLDAEWSFKEIETMLDLLWVFGKIIDILKGRDDDDFSV